MSFTDIERRYLTDPVFHSLVRTMVDLHDHAKLTHAEFRDAAALACLIRERNETRSQFGSQLDREYLSMLFPDVEAE